LAEHALDAMAQAVFDRWMSSTPTLAAAPQSFHDQWSFPIQFSGRHALVQTPYGSYFGVNGSPVLTKQNTFEDYSDLNWGEINGIALQQNDHDSPLYTDGPQPRLLRAYTGARREFAPSDRPRLESLKGAIAADGTLAKGEYDLVYIREFCTCQGNAIAYGLRNPENPNPNDYQVRLYKI
jgi:hypothetical protein